MSKLQQAFAIVKDAKKSNSTSLNLNNLELTNDELQQLMPKILELKNLKIVLLNDNRLTAIPPEIGNLTGLINLNLTNNNLNNLPSTLANLVELNELNLSHNDLSTLPEELARLTNLEKIDISNNSFVTLPQVIGNLTALKELYIESNEIAVLPAFISNLTQLHDIFAGVNRIQTIPDELQQMQQLAHVDLRLNAIQELPEAIAAMRGLEEIDLSGNPLSAECRNWLQQTFDEGVVITDMAALDETISQEVVLNALYDNYGAYYVNLLNNLPPGSFATAVEENKTAQEILKMFLEKLPIHDKIAAEVYIPAAKYLMGHIFFAQISQQEKDTQIQKIATALGNCATPVKSFLIQTYVGMQTASGESMPALLQNIIQREAVEEAILTNLKNQLRRNEKIEQVQGLVNSLFLENAENRTQNKVKISGNRSRLPSKTSYVNFAFSQVTETLAESFAKLCCKTTQTGNLLQQEGNFVLDPAKLQAITEAYLKNIGILSEREKYINLFENEMQAQLKQEDFCALHYQEQDVQEILNTHQQKKELRALLINTEDALLKEVFTAYIDTKKGQIATLRAKYAPKKLAGLTTPVNQFKRDRPPSPGADKKPKASKHQGKETSKLRKQF